ncbi:MAG: hypothetical protein AAB486_04045 [Patescibacteria group bacterium]
MINLSSFILGYPSDVLGYLFSINDWLKNTLPVAGYFRGIFFPALPQQTFLSIFLYTPAILAGAAAAYNLVMLLTLIANFLAAFFVGQRLLKSKSPALITAVIYATSLFVQWHALQNIELAMVFWLPLIILFLINLIERPSAKGLLALSLPAAAAFMTSFYLGFFSLIPVFSIWLTVSLYKYFVTKGSRGLNILYIPVFLVLFTVLTLPSTHVFFDYLGKPSVWAEYSKENIYRSSLNDVVAYGARPWDYLMPSIYHPVFGSTVRTFYQYVRENYSFQFWSTFLPERANYLTFTGMGLALYAFWTALRAWRRKTHTVSPDDFRSIGLLVALAVIMFLVSLPAVIEIKGIHLYFPSYYLFKIFPMFRVYARAGVFVLLAVSFLAGYGLKFILAKITKKTAAVLTAVLCGVVLFENINFPPLPVMDVGRVPQVYAWLKSQPGELLIAEYPRDNSVVDLGGGCPSWLDPKITRDYNGAYTAFYQTVHGKITFGTEKLSKEDRAALGDLASVDSYRVLKKSGVNYVLVHTKDPMIGVHPFPYPQENPLDDCWQRRIMRAPEKVYGGFTEVVGFDDGIIYRLQ